MKIVRIIARIIAFFDPKIREQRRELKELKRFSRMIDRANETSEKFLHSGRDKMVFGPGVNKPFYGEVPPPEKEDFKF